LRKGSRQWFKICRYLPLLPEPGPCQYGEKS